MSLPGVNIKETVELTRNDGYEGLNILLIGIAGYATAEDGKEVYTLYNYENAINKLSPPEKVKMTDSNTIKAVIMNIFNEGKSLDPNDTFGLKKVYAINVGPEPTI